MPVDGEQPSDAEIAMLFGRAIEDLDRWQGQCDSQEYFTLIRFLVEGHEHPHC